MPGLIAVGLLGALALAFAVRGKRINDHPWCRRCRYDLSGLESPTTCPECGGDLSRRRAIRIGQRRRRPVVLALGVIMLLASGGISGFNLWGIDWTPHKPVRLLLAEAHYGSAARAATARNEFVRRLTAGTLSDREIALIADAAIAAQSDLDTPWNAEWGDFVEGAWMDGRLSEDRALGFFRFGFDHSYSYKYRARVRAGQSIPVQHVTQLDRLGSRDHWRGRDRPVASFHYLGVTKDGKIVWEPRWSGPYGHVGRMSGWASGGVRIEAALEPGVHELILLHRFEVRYPYPRGEPRPHTEPPPLFSWERAERLVVEIVPEDEPLIARLADPSLAEDIRDAIKVTIVKGEYEDKWHVHIGGTVEIDDAPANVSFDIFARYNDEEVKIGGIAAHEGRPVLTGHVRIEHPRAIWPEARFVDLIFRTNPEHAERTPDILEIWDGEITINDVPVIGPPYPGDPNE